MRLYDVLMRRRCCDRFFGLELDAANRVIKRDGMRNCRNVRRGDIVLAVNGVRLCGSIEHELRDYSLDMVVLTLARVETCDLARLAGLLEQRLREHVPGSQMRL